MPSKHTVRAWVAVTPEEWRRFRVAAMGRGTDAAAALGELVTAELDRQGVQLQLPAEPASSPPSRSRRRSSSSPSSSAGSSSTPAGKNAQRPARGREKPATARKRRSTARGTVAVDGADQHAAAIAKANKRSPKAGKGRPTRRRSS